MRTVGGPDNRRRHPSRMNTRASRPDGLTATGDSGRMLRMSPRGARSGPCQESQLRMFVLHISGPGGTEAEFTVSSAALALDLALRSERAGLCWSAQSETDGEVSRLSLRSLRKLASAMASDEAERRLLDQIEWQHELQSSFALN